MTRRLRSFIPAWLTTLLLVAAGASVLVTVVEVLGLYYAYAGGRVRGVGLTWILRILVLQFDIDAASYLPARGGGGITSFAAGNSWCIFLGSPRPSTRFLAGSWLPRQRRSIGMRPDCGRLFPHSGCCFSRRP